MATPIIHEMPESELISHHTMTGDTCSCDPERVGRWRDMLLLEIVVRHQPHPLPDSPFVRHCATLES